VVFHVKHDGRPARISRRTIVSLIASLVPASVSAPASAIPEITPGDVSLAGQLLIATPVMGDPRFADTVILMVRHSKDGAMGIVINRPIGVRPLADLLRAVGEDASDANGEIRVFAGGPVQSELGFVLHESAYRRAGTFDIDGRVAMTSNREIMLDICHHAGPAKYLVAFGYAGWGPRQLEAELALHAWATTTEDPALVFDEDRAKVWDTAMARAQRAP
jgi:putative transcriptional regulator